MSKRVSFVWCPCMAINANVQYNGGFLPDILLLTQAPIFVWFDDTICYRILLLPFQLCTTLFLFCFVWWLCMAITVSECTV